MNMPRGPGGRLFHDLLAECPDGYELAPPHHDPPNHETEGIHRLTGLLQNGVERSASEPR
jgi:hypothetical protein